MGAGYSDVPSGQQCSGAGHAAGIFVVAAVMGAIQLVVRAGSGAGWATGRSSAN